MVSDAGAGERPARDADDTVAGRGSEARSEPRVPSDADPSAPDLRPSGPRQPSLVPGTVLLIVAAVLIVVVLVAPDSMAHWLRVTIAILAVCVVIALLVYSFVVFRATTRRGSGR